MRINFRPLDTLFFRDGKPFSMGEDSWADGVFPPFPSVIYGTLRSWFITNHLKPFSFEAIEESQRIRILDIKYRLPKGIHLPMPLDIALPKEKSIEEINKEKANKEYRAIQLLLKEKSSLLSTSPLPYLLLPPSDIDIETPEDGLISNEGDFESYLRGSLTKVSIRKISDYTHTEPKIGVGRDKHTKGAADSMLYRVGMRRANDFKMQIETIFPDNSLIDNTAILKIGAESKFAAIEVEPAKKASDNQLPFTLKPGAFKIYLSTPAIFKDGWKPDLSSWGLNATLIAAAVGRPLHIGGFDMEKRQPKPMFKAVPAGSVYYYHTEEPTEQILEKLHKKPISDFLGEQGFGVSYIGNI